MPGQGGGNVFVPPPRAMQATGALVGDPPQVIGVVNCRLKDDGARAQPISSHRLLPTRRHPVVADATSVAIQGATPTSMGPTPYRRP